MTIGDRIKKRRKDLDMTQTELAKCAKLSKQTIYKYENNIITNIPSDKIETISFFLRTTPSYLMGWDDSIKSSKDTLDKMKKIVTDIFPNGGAERFNLLSDGGCEITLSEDETNLLIIYQRLNDADRRKVFEHAKDLSTSTRYATKNEANYLQPIAAHNDFANDDEEQKLMLEDLDEL